jgi:hypothetical protein
LHHEAQKGALTQNEQSLISDESPFLRQADSGKALESTFIERKQMSTKTTFKRIALVAVAALGLGMLSSVPASARTSTASVTLGTPTANVAVVGQDSTITIPVTVASSTVGDTFVVSANIVAQPTGSSLTNTSFTAAGTTVSNFGGTASATYTAAAENFSASGDGVVWTLSGANVPSTAPGTATSTFTFTPAVAGTYTIAVFLDGASGVTATGAIKSLDTVKYISVTAVAAPATTVELDQPLAGSVATYDSTARANGAVIRVRLKDAAGAYTRLAGSQQVLVNLPSGVSVYKKNNVSSVATTQYGLVAGDFNASGVAFLNVSSATAGTYSLTGQLAGGSVTSTLGVTFVLPTGFSAAGDAALASADSTTEYDVKAGVSGAIYTSASAATISKTATSTTITAFGTATAKVLMLNVSDTDSRIFGLTGQALSQDMVATGATTVIAATATDGSAGSYPATFTITHSALATSSSNGTTATGFSVTPQHTSVATAPSTLAMAITGVSAAAASAYWDTALPTTTYLVVNGGSITILADLYNQYGSALTGTAVTARITAGRNLQATATNLITDAAGGVSFTVTDAASTSATTYDTVTFSYGTVTEDVTINYVAALTASTMTTSPSATTTTALSPADLGGVNTATATASTGRDTVTALLKDAAGVVIVGMPVTLTVPADVTLYSLTPAVAYTDSTGTATWSVYTTKAGTYKFTATGGGLTKDFYGKWTGSNGRVVSVTAGTTTGDTTPVTIKVSDAYGNGVSGVALSVSATGGYFQGIALSASQTTNTSGEIMVAFVGSGTVTASGTETQMFHGAALVGTTAAAGFPAGVSSASATITAGASAATVAAEAATDAAAEAIDAANAATDAANLAAEAADAATVAAEEARDAADAATAAVEELATRLPH